MPLIIGEAPLLEGAITFSRPSRDDDKETVRIVLDDKTSGTRVVEVVVEVADFTRALMGLGHMPVTFRHYGKLAGLTVERKHEKVFLPDGVGRHNKEARRQVLAPYEVDGWIGDVSYLGNMHYRAAGDEPMGVSGTWFTVPFRRYIGPDGEPVELKP